MTNPHHVVTLDESRRAFNGVNTPRQYWLYPQPKPQPQKLQPVKK